ncbi:MAG: hypothetical protein ACYDDF_09735 [Thermoplasmatota archaeon]
MRRPKSVLYIAWVSTVALAWLVYAAVARAQGTGPGGDCGGILEFPCHFQNPTDGLAAIVSFAVPSTLAVPWALAGGFAWFGRKRRTQNAAAWWFGLATVEAAAFGVGAAFVQFSMGWMFLDQTDRNNLAILLGLTAILTIANAAALLHWMRQRANSLRDATPS